MASQQKITSGDGSTNINVIGDGNTISIGGAKLPLDPLLTFTLAREERGAALLAPNARLVETLIGRDDLLDKMEHWLFEDERMVSWAVLTGEGGAGKTRLAWELCITAYEKQKWDVGFLSASGLQSVLSQQSAGSTKWRKPTLAVIDYAGPYARDIRDLLAALAKRQKATEHPLRVILLERQASMDEGWLPTALSHGSNDFFVVAPLLLNKEPIKLMPLDDTEWRRNLIEDTLAALGSKQTIPEPGEVREFDEKLQNESWAGQPLYLMMAAFVCDQFGWRDVLKLDRRALAKHQAGRELWRLRRFGNREDATEMILTHMAAYATLCGGLDQGVLTEVVEEESKALKVPPPGGAGLVARKLLAALPRHTFKAGRKTQRLSGMAPVLPDIVGEALVYEQLAQYDQQQVLDVLSRARKYGGEAVAITLIRCVQDYYVRENPDTHVLLHWLTHVVQREDSLEGWMRIEDAFPRRFLAMSELPILIDGAIRELLRPSQRDLDPSMLDTLGAASNNLATRLSDLNKNQEALVPVTEGVDIYRSLAGLMPDTYLPHLAMSLNNQARILSGMHNHMEALAPAQEAITIFRKLVSHSPEQFRPLLAMGLNNLARAFSGLGQYAEALEPEEEAMAIRRNLAKEMPETYRPELAHSLNNLSSYLAELGRDQEALPVAQEAAGIRRLLAQEMPETHLPHLASSLTNLAHSAAALGKGQLTLETAQEVVDIYRSLAQDMPETFLPGLAKAMSNASTFLSQFGHHDAALQSVQESIDIRRILARKHPDLLSPDLAGSLTNLSGFLSDIGRHQEALEPATEAVDMYRSLAQGNPNIYRPHFAKSLNNLARTLSGLGRHQEALKPAKESLDIYRALAESMPAAHAPDLAMYLHNQAARFYYLGRYHDAVATSHEAISALAQSFLDRPLIFSNTMKTIASAYLKFCQAAQVEDDHELLDPIITTFEQLQQRKKPEE